MFKCYFFSLMILFIAENVSADEYYWSYWNTPGQHYSTVLEACSQFLDPGYTMEVHMQNPAAAYCQYTRLSDGDPEGYGVDRHGSNCPAGTFSNDTMGYCGNDQQKGKPLPESCVGNPIGIATGNKYQTELDYQTSGLHPIIFSIYYNGMDNLWRHSYSSSVQSVVGRASLIRDDGQTLFFGVSSDIIAPDILQEGVLSKRESGWSYTSADNSRYDYDTNGRLTAITDPQGSTQQLTYANGQITVSDAAGHTLTLTEDAQHQPLSLSAANVQISYTYDANQHLIQVTKTQGAQVTQRQFLYEDSRNTGLLTGIIDERGVRFATWAYDAQGRAISSQHSGGAGLTTVSYNTDGSSTVTNELGKLRPTAISKSGVSSG